MAENYDDFGEMAHDARRALEREREELMERAEQLNVYMQLLDRINEVVAENRRLRDDYEEVQRQLDDEKQQRAELEMKLMEMTKLSAGVAKKASQEELLKAIRVFVNKSKRKKIEKRIAVKEMVLEMAFANGLDLPEDLKASIESLDDEQAEPKIMTVQGNYNDIHDNGTVNSKD